MQKWEYLNLNRRFDYKGLVVSADSFIAEWADGDEMDFEERLNYLGDQGWEVVSIYPVSSLHAIENAVGSTTSAYTTSVRILLKRPK